MEVMLLGRVTLVSSVQYLNALSPREVTGNPLIVLGIVKSPVALGLLPVIVMALPLLENNNSAFEVAVNVSSSASAQALKFFNSRLTIGELLGNYWGTIGELLGNCWGTVGELLVCRCLCSFILDTFRVVIFQDLPPSIVVSRCYLTQKKQGRWMTCILTN